MHEHGKRAYYYLGILLLIIGIISLFFYSFTQVDLNLTLSRISLVSALQGFFQYIGYFERPFSTFWYVATVLLLFASYILILNVQSYSVSAIKRIKKIILAVAVLLTFSYPAFSYDIYNYMFDARIVTRYNENPYERKALDYPEDPWVNFMRWTHRTYPYGPAWLGLSVPLSYLGFGKFVPTVLLFKALMTVSYVAAGFLIYRILLLIRPEKAIYGAILFCLNPLVVIEALVSGHNDIVMMALALASIYFLIRTNYIISAVFLLLSIGIKFATVFLVPAFGYYAYAKYRHQKIHMSTFLMIAAVGMLGAVAAASARTQFQPWYLLYIFPLLSIIGANTAVRLMVVLGFAGAMLYVPFLYIGDWNPPVPLIINIIVFSGVVLSCVILIMPLVARLTSRALPGRRS